MPLYHSQDKGECGGARALLDSPAGPAKLPGCEAESHPDFRHSDYVDFNAQCGFRYDF